jgi:rhamnose utilization protein RhaD (predicted bifunctional aldolase and dehydrogenase)
MSTALGDPEFARFVALSARLGGEPLLVQAAGGNTSLKCDGTLWIKASGKLLRRAEVEDTFVPLDLAGVRAGIKQDEPDPTAGNVLGGSNLRPSIEATLHALLPHRLVLHLHSVNALAWEVRSDGQALVAERLSGLPWTWVEYRRPGLPLTRAVRAAAADGVDVFALASHGIVVGAPDCASGEALLREVERRLASPPRAPSGADAVRLAAFAAATGYRSTADPTIQALATDPSCLAHARSGALYPDHVVFLGAEACVVDNPDSARETMAAYCRRQKGQPAYVIAAGAGVLIEPGAAPAVEEMLHCQAELLLRLPPGAPLRFLSTEEVDELLNWDAEKFRRALGAR